jgi:hypothetical protein
MNHFRIQRQREAQRRPRSAAGYTIEDKGPPTAGEVIREAMLRVLTVNAATMEGDHQRCRVRDCRRERECLAPGGVCRARPPVEIANVEEKHGWLLEIMRKELSDILVARTLGR